MTIALWPLIATSLMSCKKSHLSSMAASKRNMPPFANAGPDQTLILPLDSCELKGTGTDPDGTIVRYAWSISVYYLPSGRNESFSDTTQNLKLRNLQRGWYRCTLTVTDDVGLWAKDDAVVNVGLTAGCPCYPDPCDTVANPCNPWDY